MPLHVCVAGAWQVCVVVMFLQVCEFDLQVCAVPLQVCDPPLQDCVCSPLQVCVCAPLQTCDCEGPVCGQLAAVASHHSTLSFS